MAEENWEEGAWHLLYGLGKIREAIKYLDELLRKNPGNDKALAIKANALNELANTEKIGSFLQNQSNVQTKP